MPITIVDQDKKEGVGEIQDFFTIDTPDSELVQMIDKKIQNASKEFENFRKEGKQNERYWSKDQLEGISLRWHNSRIVENRTYMTAETMVPIITSKPAEPMITIADEDNESDEITQFIRNIERVLLDKYYDEDFPQQELFEMIARHLLLYKIGIPKIIWDETIDDYIIEFVHPHKLIISPDGHYNHDVWVAQYLEKKVKDLVDMFPEKENDILANLFPGHKVSVEEYGNTPIGFWEYWPEDGKFVVWKMQDEILQKKLNPYIKWTDDKKFDSENNHFDYPKKPYMFLNSQNLGRHVWDDTTPISQGLTLQDGINLMQRVITDTAKDQGILVGAQEMIDRDELYKYTGAPNEKLSVKGGDPTKALYRVPPKELKQYILEYLLHLENSYDNVTGVHSTTRGEKSRNNTLGQDVMAKESDYGRIDAIVRGIERVATEMYNWELQMMIVKYESKHFQRVLGEKSGKELFKKLKDTNKKGIKIAVKPGSTLPTDKISQRTEAIELAKANKISDIDFFKKMDYPNAKEMAKNLYLQANAPELLYPDVVKKIQNEKKKALKNGDIPPTTPPMTTPPMANQPIVPNMQAPVAQPPIPEAGQTTPMQQQQAQIGTEHTQALISGQQVAPFEGIPPSPEHVSAELQFMGNPEFLNLPEQIQAMYASHVLQERQQIQGAQQAPQ